MNEGRPDGTSEPRVSIGLPTYNRPELLALVLENFRTQTFSDFELVVSDNASPDTRVRDICERYALEDARFRYVRQSENIGAEQNFWFVFDQCRAPIFLWASDDDLWPRDFIERAVAVFKSNTEAAAWFCQVANIDMAGEIGRRYPSFSRFASTAKKARDLARFLWEPEVLGKANLIYSVFRRDALRDVVELFRGHSPAWGSDMHLVYAFLCRNSLVIDDGVVLRKRVPTPLTAVVPNPRQLIYPASERGSYFAGYRRVARGTGYGAMTMAVLSLRSAYDWWHNRRTIGGAVQSVSRAVNRLRR